jgi:large subunit ribosomal protein L25
MKTLEIIGFKRANLGTKEAKRLRAESNVPCVVYGGKEEIHFYSPMILFRDLVYTGDAHMVELNIEGDKRKCILQEIQFHPVNEIILHADFLELRADKEVKMDIPVKLEGTPIGIQKGGKLETKLRKLTLRALPDNMPDYVPVQVGKLDLGKTIKVGDLKATDYTILNNPLVTIAAVNIPRLRAGAITDEDLGIGEEEAEGAGGEGEEGEGEAA